MKNKKKLVIFIGGLNFGGMERVAFIMADLLKDDYDITIATLYQSNADYTLEHKTYNLDVSPKEGKINKILIAVKRLMATKKMKAVLKPDYVFSFGMYSNYMNALSKKNEKIIMGIRSYDWLTNPFTTSTIDKKIIAKFNSINSVSKLISADAEKYWGINKNDVRVIYNPYEVNLIRKKSLEEVDDFPFDEKAFYYISMGRLSHQKAYYHLIKAFSLVAQRHDNVRLVIMGNGEHKERLQELIALLKIEDKAFLIGGKLNPYKYVRRGQVYVVSSLTEGFPNALVEAMCVGIPVLSTDCNSGPREILAPNTDIHSKCEKFELAEYGVLVPEVTDVRDFVNSDMNACDRKMAEGMEYLYLHEGARNRYVELIQKRVLDFDYDSFKDCIKKELEKVEV
ncbi:glycosyltransferase [Blautia schinkii]|nr:glycosyltransferase [Blautia schinkii]